LSAAGAEIGYNEVESGPPFNKIGGNLQLRNSVNRNLNEAKLRYENHTLLGSEN
jgi:hypothetical protein